MLAAGHLTVGTGIGLATAPVFTDNVLAGGAWVAIVTASSLLPDIDSESSTVTKSLGPITKVLSFFVRLVTSHRGFTHKDIGIVLWAVALVLALQHLHLPIWLGLASGMGCAAHVLADCWTKGGVKPFALFPKWRVQISDEKAGAGSEPWVAGAVLVAGAVACGMQVF